MAALSAFVIGTGGGAPSPITPAAGGDTVEVSDRVFVVAKNTDAASKRVVFATPGNLVTGDDFPDKEYTVAATNGEEWIPVLAVYRDSSIQGRASLTYPDGVIGLTLHVVRR